MTFTPHILAKRKHANPLLSRKELLLEILHGTNPCPAHKDIKAQIAKKFKTEERNIVLFGFRTVFGGGKTHGFCLIYDNIQALLKFEPKYRLRRLEILPKRNPSRKAEKELKKKIKKTRAGERRKVLAQRKKELPRHTKLAKEQFLKKLGM